MIHIPSQNISKLDLSGKNLTEIPEEIFELKNLKKLNLSDNKLHKIPKEIIKLKRLETLDLSKNRINNFFAKICELDKLKILNLNQNRIKTIPIQIELLKNLRVLQIASNKLNSFPKQFEKLNKLEQLNIANNPISYFPKEILELKSLKKMWLNNLLLESFPTSKLCENLNHLESIYCYGNITNKKLISEDFFELTMIKGNCLTDMLIKGNKEKNQEKNEKLNSKKATPNKNKIFISYSHKDNSWLEKVQTNLEVLKYNGFEFSLWDDTKIQGGNKWKKEIYKALEESGIAILIISTDFLASKFIRNDELPTILRNAEEKGTHVLPLVVRPCRFLKDKNLSEFQAINDPNKALSDLKEPDAEKELMKLTDVVSNILLE